MKANEVLRDIALYTLPQTPETYTFGDIMIIRIWKSVYPNVSEYMDEYNLIELLEDMKTNIPDEMKDYKKNLKTYHLAIDIFKSYVIKVSVPSKMKEEYVQYLEKTKQDFTNKLSEIEEHFNTIIKQFESRMNN